MDIPLFSALAETARRDIDRIQQEIEAKRGELAGRRLLAEALPRLRDSWQDGDPGKYRSHWFFVRRYAIGDDGGRKRVAAYEKFWVRDLVTDLAAAEKRCRDGQLGAIAECAREECPTCHHKAGKAPVVGRFRQTEDGIDGDSWELQLFVLCGPCRALSPLGDDFRATYHY